MPCEHFNFMVRAEVGRLTESETDKTVIAFNCDLKVFCSDCDEQFEFIGLPLGFNHYGPTVSIDNKVAHLPIMVAGRPPRAGLPGYSVKQTFCGDEPIKQ